MKDDYFKPGSERSIIAIYFIIVFACLLRFYQLSFFEFKNDQLQAILMGEQAQSANFLITHGMGSGVGVNNPPLFLWFMGLVTFFTRDPLAITVVFTVINIAALCIAARYFYLYLPLNFAVLASFFLAFSPAFTLYSNIIWAQCLLPAVMVFFHLSLYKIITEERAGKYFLWLIVLACVAAQLHMSGFFVFPVVFIIGLIYRDKIKTKALFLSVLIAFAIFLPFLVHLFAEGEWGKLFIYAAKSQRHIYWKLFREHLRISSFDFFRYYFRHDFAQVLRKSAGPLRYILYPLTWGLILAFVTGFVSYLALSLRSRKFFVLGQDVLKKYPLVYQISGFMVLVVSAGYLFFRVQTPMHYLIVLFPSYAILSASAAYRIWKYRFGRVMVFASLISTVLLLLAVLVFLEGSGGHAHEYGFSHRAILECKNELRGLIKNGQCPLIEVHFSGEGKTDSEAIAYAMTGGSLCSAEDKLVPVRLDIKWNNRLLRYEHTMALEENL
jgi:hypothetical protein